MALGICIFLFAVLSCILSGGFVHGSIQAVNNVKLPKHKGIENEDGDVIDCVDIYKQPAFDHPILKNQTIQMKPSSFPKVTNIRNETAGFLEAWPKSVDCPKGTIPIIRTQKRDNDRPLTSVQYAQVRSSTGTYNGAQGYLNLWNPKTADGDYSSSHIWIVSGNSLPTKNVIQAGWTVRTPDRQTRLVISWTRDGYRRTGCYNHECPGFVQTSSSIALGSTFQSISKYGGVNYETRITIHKDMVTGNWWLTVHNQVVGYWPKVLFTSLASRAQYLFWGGEVGSDGYLKTPTEMGSGHFPSEGLYKASYIRSLGYVDDAGFMKDPGFLAKHVLNPSWYDVIVPSQKLQYFGVYFFFGGPGHGL